MPQPHTAHRFTRHVSTADDGRRIYGCTHGSDFAGCAETEIRHPNQPSPFELKQQAKKAAKGGSNARREGA